jgi:phenylacetate-CoA ligase
MLLFSLIKQVRIQKRQACLSYGEIRVLQRKKFLQLVQFAVEHSSYYKKIIKKHGIDIAECKPEDFPILTKEDLINNFDEIVTDKQITKKKIEKFLLTSQNPTDFFLDKFIVIRTSGSTGAPGYYVYTVPDFVKGVAASTRVFGTKFFQKLAYIGAINGHFGGITIVNAARQIPLLYREVQTFDINQPFPSIIEKLNAMQPTNVTAYAFALRELAKAQREGKLRIHPRFIQSGGEPLGTEDKRYIQDVFQVEVANVYASSEHLLMGIGRDSFGGMYLMEDSLIFEICETYINVTNLYNYLLPLIRYRMSDRLQTVADTTHQFPFTKIKEIVGRNEFVPVFLNDDGREDLISPLILVDFYAEHLQRFQFHIINNRQFIFKACLDSGITEKQKERAVKQIEKNLKTLLAGKRMTKVAFEIKLVDQLWVDPKTGKFRLFIKTR